MTGHIEEPRPFYSFGNLFSCAFSSSGFCPRGLLGLFLHCSMGRGLPDWAVAHSKRFDFRKLFSLKRRRSSGLFCDCRGGAALQNTYSFALHLSKVDAMIARHQSVSQCLELEVINSLNSLLTEAVWRTTVKRSSALFVS